MEKVQLDEDWLLLLKELKELGVSKEQFKELIEAKKCKIKETEKTSS